MRPHPLQGLAYCFWASLGFLLIALTITTAIEDDAGGLTCGSRACFLPPQADVDAEAGGDGSAPAVSTALAI